MVKVDRMDPELMSLRNRMNARSGWDKETDRKGRAARARAGKLQKKLQEIAREIDPDGTMPAEELAARIKTRVALEKDQRAYELALDRRKQQKKAAGPSAATDEPASETTTNHAASTGQESR